MQRVPEPDLMDDEEQARAYAGADFTEPNQSFVERFGEYFPNLADRPLRVLDLGCGPADVSVRFARAYPRATVDAVDGSKAMLTLARELVRSAQMTDRVVLHHGVLPTGGIPNRKYDAVLSNSLLHHLKEPSSLWWCVKRYSKEGAAVLTMDLRRPHTRAEAETLVETYATGEPEVLRRDFFNSLLAAYRVDETYFELARAGLAHLRVAPVGDRHLVVWGRC